MEEVKPTQMPLSLGLENDTKRRFHSKFSALISLLKIQLAPKDYVKEASLIKNIIKKGFTEKQIYGAYNYYVFTKHRSVNSFALLLWNDCQLVKEAIPYLDGKIIVKEHVKLDALDHRTSRDYILRSKTIKDFLYES